ncbi:MULTISPECIES: tetratricopeptide repeat protein [unclassified Burkholderia]|uniref:O-linked N-acetylglucosamine transferase, SPINDLY family protein n=1 Tax=unclassified Burkholderia TaxID=2613784 RepID=UPI001E62DA5B|nr:MULTISPECIES: tetratricopeptide repeat protein [unclassified Burkholderia]UEP28037.1 tetratricopeptide repeat protein [Burkholderia sp. B21-007]UEP41538.1 tetratricopeptide repeat protein [Burkholderia sp. B21-005]
MMPTSPAAATIEQALAHHQADRLDEAETLYRQILDTDPRHADALHLLGLIGHQYGRYQEASDLIMAAIETRPDPMYYYNLGNVMQADNRHAAAAECFRLAIELRPDYVDAYNNLGNALRLAGDARAAVDAFCQAIALKPDNGQAYNNLANALFDLNEIPAALEAYRHAVALRPELPEPRSNLLFASHCSEAFDHDAYLAEAARYDEVVTRCATPWTDWLVDLTARAGRPLKVGIVSGDLKAHPVGYFIESMLKHLDANRIEMHAYPTRDVEDDVTARIKPAFATWTCIAGLSDEAAAARVRADRIDVLLDAAGHTVYNRLPLFAWKPAPLQASWPGYFASTGVRAIDYVIGDRHVLPPAEAAHFTERPWHLPDSYLCFTPPAEPIDVGALPMLANGHPTFGYFGKLAKLTDHVVAAWSRVLQSVAGAKLFVKAEHLDDPREQQALAARFAAHGIDAQRLILEGRSPRAEYLAAYWRVDLMLSPFPYPGGTTTAEALWMGVPVLCRRGERFLSHIAESLLHSARLPEWIAHDDDAYVAKAVAQVGQPAELAALRTTLRAQVLASPLCDAPRFARHFEDALHGMWAQHVEAAPAASV